VVSFHVGPVVGLYPTSCRDSPSHTSCVLPFFVFKFYVIQIEIVDGIAPFFIRPVPHGMRGAVIVNALGL
jgi:hypothetical protein